MAEKWPLDFEALQRGDILSAEECEKAVLLDRGDPTYWTKLLGLRDDVVDYFRAARGDIVAVRILQDGLHILTHQEQAEYAPHLLRRHMRGVAKSVAIGAGVDLAVLSDESRQRHERFLHVSSFKLQQLRKRPPPRLEG